MNDGVLKTNEALAVREPVADPKSLDNDLGTVEQELAAQRAVLTRIVKECSWVREEHDPLVRIGLMALDGLSKTGEGWVSPKQHQAVLQSHQTALRDLRARCAAMADELGSAMDSPDLRRFAAVLLSVPLERS